MEVQSSSPPGLQCLRTACCKNLVCSKAGRFCTRHFWCSRTLKGTDAFRLLLPPFQKRGCLHLVFNEASFFQAVLKTFIGRPVSMKAFPSICIAFPTSFGSFTWLYPFSVSSCLIKRKAPSAHMLSGPGYTTAF